MLKRCSSNDVLSRRPNGVVHAISMGDSDEDAVRSRLHKVMAEIEVVADLCEIPSISIGVLHHGKVLLRESKGLRDAENEVYADANTTYLTASLSKTFLVAALGILVDDGKLRWSDKVSKHVPDFDPIHGRGIRHQIDFIDLLRHSSGLLNPTIHWIGPFGSILADRDSFMSLVNETPICHDNEPKFQYSNIAYGIAAIAVENVSGMSYANFLDERILKPLRLDRTFVVRSKAEQDDNAAHSYARQVDETWSRIDHEYTGERYPHVLGTIGVRSCVNDLLRWCAAVMAAEDVSGSAVPDCISDIETNPLKQMDNIRTPYWSFGPRHGMDTEAAYCLGWVRAVMPSAELGWGSYNKMTADCDDAKQYILGMNSPRRIMYKHTGLAPGVCCAMFTFPETCSAVVALSNGLSCADGSDFAAQMIIQELFDLQPRVDLKSRIMLEREKRWNNFDLMLMRGWLQDRDVTNGPEKPDDFVGDYKAMGLTVSVQKHSETQKLVMCFARREDLPIWMEYYNHDTYSVLPTTWDTYQRGGWHDWDYHDIGLFHFHRDEKGVVDGFHWRWDAHQERAFFSRITAA